MPLIPPPSAPLTGDRAAFATRHRRPAAPAWRLTGLALALTLLVLAPPSCEAQRGRRGGGLDQGAVRDRVRNLVEEIQQRRDDGYDVAQAEALLDDLRAALAHKDRAEAQRIGSEIRRRLDAAPRLGRGIPAAPAELWTKLAPGDVAATWSRTEPRFGLLDCYMNTDLANAQRLVRGLGVQFVRLSAPLSGGLNWGSVERERGRYDWRKADSVMAQVRLARVEPMITLGITNEWDAIDCHRTRATARQLPCDLDAYSRFVRAAVARYKATVHVWQVWNEPDDTGHWADTPEHYADLVLATSKAVQAADLWQ